MCTCGCMLLMGRQARGPSEGGGRLGRGSSMHCSSGWVCSWGGRQQWASDDKGETEADQAVASSDHSLRGLGEGLQGNGAPPAPRDADAPACAATQPAAVAASPAAVAATVWIGSMHASQHVATATITPLKQYLQVGHYCSAAHMLHDDVHVLSSSMHHTPHHAMHARSSRRLASNARANPEHIQCVWTVCLQHLQTCIAICSKRLCRTVHAGGGGRAL
jgi:hypothetical protein